MHILIILLGLLGGAAFWWYRIRYLSEAASEVADAVGRVRGSVRRKQLRKQAELSPLATIDDPVVAAATLIIAIVTEGMAIAPDRENVIRSAISEIANVGKADEAVIYGKWAASQIDDANVVIDKLGPFLRDCLNESERHHVLDMIRDVAAAGGSLPPLLDRRVQRLRQKFGFQVN
ncbi:hypothetical protein [Hoeflea sp. 108]|jgi:uncharacterized tellurite resistance protein B-like protein|uniref:hypothetical protein n=1 Tax=Hoeflea sp. 108 TaxID=1116369 RepID=UPI00037B79C9|nr:hypothetical protein [Hoeflea sp. 108]